MMHPGSVFIVRIDGTCTHGWQVRVYKKNEKYHSKLFSDGVWGGKHKAQAAAKQYKEKCLKKVPARERGRLERSRRYGRAWGRGILYIQRQRNGGCIEKAWIGWYYDSEYLCQVKRQFSCRIHGYRKAKELAEHFRKTGIAKVAKFGKADERPRSQRID